MSEKRFVAEQVDVVNEDETEVWDIVFDTENTYAFMVRDTDTANELCDLLNKFSSEIEELNISISLFEDDIATKDKKIGEQQATIEQLQAQLREKEEDERLYANEILELRETNKEHIKFKSLGGDY